MKTGWLNRYVFPQLQRLLLCLIRLLCDTTEHLSTPISWNHFMLPHSCNLHSDDDTWRSMNTFLCKAVLKDGLLKENYDKRLTPVTFSFKHQGDVNSKILFSTTFHSFRLNSKINIAWHDWYKPGSSLSSFYPPSPSTSHCNGTIDSSQDRRDTFGSLLWFAKEQFSKLAFAPVSSSQLVIDFIQYESVWWIYVCSVSFCAC